MKKLTALALGLIWAFGSAAQAPVPSPLAYTVNPAQCSASAPSAEATKSAVPSLVALANQQCVCNLRTSNTLCSVQVTVSFIANSGECVAALEYNKLTLQTTPTASNVGVIWQLKAGSGADAKDFAFSPGQGIHIAKQGNIVGETDGGFLNHVRFNDYNAIWFARSLPASTEFRGMHIPVVIRKYSDQGLLNVCTPSDPPIINTGG